MNFNPRRLVSITPNLLIIAVIAMSLSVLFVSYYSYSKIIGFDKFKVLLSISNMIVCLYMLTIIWQWAIYNAFSGYKRSFFYYLVNILLLYIATYWLSGIVYMNVIFYNKNEIEFFLIPQVMSDVAYYSYIIISFNIAKIIVTKEYRNAAHFFDYLGTAIQVVFFPLTFYFLQERVYKLSKNTE